MISFYLLVFINLVMQILSLVTDYWGRVSNNDSVEDLGLFSVCNENKSCSSYKNKPPSGLLTTRYLSLSGAFMSLTAVIAMIIKKGNMNLVIKSIMILGGLMNIIASIIFKIKVLKPKKGLKQSMGYSLYLNLFSGILSVMTAFI